MRASRWSRRRRCSSSADTKFGRDVMVEPYVVFGPGVTVEDNAVIRSFSHLDRAHVGKGALVGPYARLRPGAKLGADVHIGNFVEIKEAVIEDGAKANHLAYIGDARLGAGANFGAGAIVCNYDGVAKHRTDIGKGAFIGSNCRAGRAGHDRRRRLCRDRLGDHARRAGRRAGDRARAAGGQGEAAPPHACHQGGRRRERPPAAE